MIVFGCNDDGQLGLRHDDDQNRPTLLMQGISIHQITCGYYNTIILQENGDAIAFGYNHDRQLGLGHNKNQNSPVLVIQNAILLSGFQWPNKWSPENHHKFGVTFRQNVYTFLLIHKRNQMNTGLKIPKFVLFEIFKQI